MSSSNVFWVVATALALGCLVLMFAPMYFGSARSSRRASHDMQIFRDQLREIDADVARGVLTKDEAGATRTEISRRLLAAADAEAIEAAGVPAPRNLSRVAAALVGATALCATVGLYLWLGAPGYGDQPLAKRIADEAEQYANRPTQAEAEEMIYTGANALAEPDISPDDQELIDQLLAALEENPTEAAGFDILARSMASLGRWREAQEAKSKAVALAGDTSDGRSHIELAELMILSAQGYISPEAEAALGRGLEIAPSDPLGRYYAGRAALQGSRPDITYQLWTNLLREGPPDAPWIEPIEAQIGEVARMAGLTPPASSAPAPTQAEIDAAQEMDAADRQAMIAGMVDSLSARLAEEGGPPQDWARLIRSLGVMGRIQDASEIWREAQSVFADDPAALGLINQAARDGELIQ